MSERSKLAEVTKVEQTKAWDPVLLVDSNRQAFECWSRAVTALTQEIGQFVQARLQEDLNIWTKLTACKNVNDAFECQRQFLQKATTDYVDEANKLSRLTMTMASDGLAAMRGEKIAA